MVGHGQSKEDAPQFDSSDHECEADRVYLNIRNRVGKISLINYAVMHAGLFDLNSNLLCGATAHLRWQRFCDSPWFWAQQAESVRGLVEDETHRRHSSNNSSKTY